MLLYESENSIITSKVEAELVANIIRVNNTEFEFKTAQEALEAFENLKNALKSNQPWEKGRFFVSPQGYAVEWAGNTVTVNGKTLYFNNPQQARQYFEGLKSRFTSGGSSGGTEGGGSGGVSAGGGGTTGGGQSSQGVGLIVATRNPTVDDVYDKGFHWVNTTQKSLFLALEKKDCNGNPKTVWFNVKTGEVIDLSTVNTCDIWGDGSSKGLFTFDDTLEDSCGNFHLQGNEVIYQQGKWGKAVYVTDDNPLEFSTGPVIVGSPLTLGKLLATNRFTLSFWLKATSLPATTQNAKSHTVLACKTDFYFGLSYYHTDTYNNKADFRIAIGNGNNYTYWRYIGENHSLIGDTWNQWHHWVVVKDNSTIKVYLDGQLVDTDTNAPQIVEKDPYRIGLWGGGYRTGTRLLVDQFRIFDRPLTGGEVQILNKENLC